MKNEVENYDGVVSLGNKRGSIKTPPNRRTSQLQHERNKKNKNPLHPDEATYISTESSAHITVQDNRRSCSGSQSDGRGAPPRRWGPVDVDESNGSPETTSSSRPGTQSDWLEEPKASTTGIASQCHHVS